MKHLAVTITIGRNVGIRPMSNNQWATFKAEIADLFETLWVNVCSEGEWQGIKEQPQVFVGETNQSQEYLEQKLALIAKLYEQDACGLIINQRPTSLVRKAA